MPHITRLIKLKHMIKKIDVGKDIAPSILSADFSRLGEHLKQAEAAGIQMLHIDVMDRHFVPNLTFGPFIVDAIRQAGIGCKLDVHLMVDPADPLIDDFIKKGVDRISFHPEATHNLADCISRIKQAGCECGIVLNPDQNWDRIIPYIKQLDFVLLMTVYPGFSGQSFIESVKPKISALKKYLDQVNPACRIQLDGGVSLQNIVELRNLGADHFVMGSAFFSQTDFKSYLNACQQALDNH